MMKSGTYRSTFFRQIRKDKIIQSFLLLFIIVHIPYFLPTVTFDQLYIYGWIVSAGFLLPFTVILLWPRRRDSIPGSERDFWQTLSFAFFLWWLISIIHLIWWDGLSELMGIGTDSLLVSVQKLRIVCFTHSHRLMKV